jgi:hypothetical protein
MVSLVDIGVSKEHIASVFEVKDCRVINYSPVSKSSPKTHGRIYEDSLATKLP